MPLFATCTASPERQVRESESAGVAAEDERLVALLIDGSAAQSR